MRFTYLLSALAASSVVSAQDLNSLLSEASVAVGTNSEYQSLLSSAESVLTSATAKLTGTAASVYSSYISALESGGLGYVTSAVESAATGALGGASASATSATQTGNGVDRVVLPAMGAFGAAVLGLAAML